jgi:integrase
LAVSHNQTDHLAEPEHASTEKAFDPAGIAAGLRAAEPCDLRWDQVDFNAAVLHVRRVKNGTHSTHPLLGDELGTSASGQRDIEHRRRRLAFWRAICVGSTVHRPWRFGTEHPRPYREGQLFKGSSASFALR